MLRRPLWARSLASCGVPAVEPSTTRAGTGKVHLALADIAHRTTLETCPIIRDGDRDSNPAVSGVSQERPRSLCEDTACSGAGPFLLSPLRMIGSDNFSWEKPRSLRP